jgi:hypothetical protein
LKIVLLAVLPIVIFFLVILAWLSIYMISYPKICFSTFFTSGYSNRNPIEEDIKKMPNKKIDQIEELDEFENQ